MPTSLASVSPRLDLAFEVSPEPISQDDYRWLVSSDAAGWLSDVAASDQPLVRQAQRLRKTLSAARAHLVLEQVELRRRARVKFQQADLMFFTRLGLEQATDEVIAEFKAERFSTRAKFDLCCGIGGDLLGLAKRGDATAIDRDPIAALVATANCEALGLGRGSSIKIYSADVQTIRPDATAEWHLDPDRRPHGKRTTRVEIQEPGIDFIDRLLDWCGNGAVKVAPATVVPDRWAMEGELQWISNRRECRQLVAWFGRLARHPGRHTAAVLKRDGTCRTVVGDARVDVPVAPMVGRYIYEPDAAVLAADLTGSLAQEQSLAAIASGVAYLTSDQEIIDDALASFEVLEVLPYAERVLKKCLADRGIGRVEVKKRGVELDPAKVARQLRGRGDHQATLLISRSQQSTLAILARRLGQ